MTSLENMSWAYSYFLVNVVWATVIGMYLIFKFVEKVFDLR